jgi:hypothetical protein
MTHHNQTNGPLGFSFSENATKVQAKAFIKFINQSFEFHPG